MRLRSKFGFATGAILVTWLSVSSKSSTFGRVRGSRPPAVQIPFGSPKNGRLAVLPQKPDHLEKVRNTSCGPGRAALTCKVLSLSRAYKLSQLFKNDFPNR